MTLVNKIYAIATSATLLSTTGALFSYFNGATEAVKKHEVIEQKSEGSFLENAFCCGGDEYLI